MVERRLAAILAADMVGFSRLMERDEARTLALQRTFMTSVVSPALAAAGGRLVKTTGDGFLAEFASVVSAVRSAIDMQKAQQAAMAHEAADARVLYRMGLNLGDVVLEAGDVFGDGVNVAARLEPLAPPGGLAVSGVVHDQMAGRIDAAFADLGDQSLKNISRPVRVYCWPAESVAARPAAGADRKAALFVAGFEATPPSDEARGLALGVQTAVHAGLSSLTGLRVVAQEDQCDFVVSGSLQVMGGKYRAVVRMTDRAEGDVFLSSSIGGDLGNVFDTQDDLASRMANTIRYAVHDRVAKRAAAAPETAGPDGLLAMSGQIMLGSDRAEWVRAGPLLERAVAAQPGNFMALTLRGLWHIQEAVIGVRPIPPEAAATADSLLRRAQALNGRSDFVHMCLALYHCDVAGALREAQRAIERAVEINPHYTVGASTAARIRVLSGDRQQGLAEAEACLPRLTTHKVYHRVLTAAALAQFAVGDYDTALDRAERALLDWPDFAPALSMKIAALSHLGREAEAREAMAQMRAAYPDFARATFRTVCFADTELLDRLMDGLARAGVT